VSAMHRLNCSGDPPETKQQEAVSANALQL